MTGAKQHVLLAGILILITSTPALADVPREMTFQGRLTGNGTGPVSIRVRFWDAPTGGNQLWAPDGELHTNVPRPDGLFTINIGSQTTGGTPDAALDYKRLDPNSTGAWLGISVNGGPELTPRTKVGLVAFAAKATSAEQLTLPGTFDPFLSFDSAGRASVSIGLDVLNAPGAGTALLISHDYDYSSSFPQQLVVRGASDDSRRLKIGYHTTDNYGSIQAEGGGGFTRLALNPFGGNVAIGNVPQGIGRLELFQTVTDVDGGLTWTAAYGDSARAFLKPDGTGDFNWHLTRGGSHTRGIVIANEGSVGIGTSTMQAKLDVNGSIRGHVVQITGGSDLAEPADVSDAGLGADAVQPGMVVSIDPANPGKLIVATEAYDRKVAGVISGAGGVQPGMIMKQEGHPTADGEHPIAMAGKVYVWCDADAGGPITPGDCLTTSNRPGHAMKATDRERMDRAVIGKAMTGLKEGKGLVLMLVQPQ